ncbi:MAG: PspA/IM30 family protein [Candidatus Wallbacteria bacterium]
MGIFSRIQSIISAKINGVLDMAEDPEQMIDQTLNEMQDCLREAKVAVSRAVRDKNLLEQKCADTDKQVEYWQDKAKLAVEKNDDALAKEALKRKKEYADISTDLKLQLDTMVKNVEALKNSVAALESKMEEARRKKEVLLARKKNAEASIKINENVSQYSSVNTTAFDTFDRMEKKVNEKEAEAQAVQELANPDIDLKTKFKNLEENDEVDKDLAELKKQMGK